MLWLRLGLAALGLYTGVVLARVSALRGTPGRSRTSVLLPQDAPLVPRGIGRRAAMASRARGLVVYRPGTRARLVLACARPATQARLSIIMASSVVALHALRALAPPRGARFALQSVARDLLLLDPQGPVCALRDGTGLSAMPGTALRGTHKAAPSVFMGFGPLLRRALPRALQFLALYHQ